VLSSLAPEQRQKFSTRRARQRNDDIGHAQPTIEQGLDLSPIVGCGDSLAFSRGSKKDNFVETDAIITQEIGGMCAR